MTTEAEGATLLSVTDLSVEFRTKAGRIKAVKNVSFDVKRGEVVCLVGESGSGKSVTALSILNLVPSPAGKITDGAVNFESEDLLKLSIRNLQQIRGDRIAMIFQEPTTSLNPVHRVARQIGEALELHRGLRNKKLLTKVEELLSVVRISDPRGRRKDYPHQFSGGMQQRAMIAMAISCEPDLIIADEPTTALDVTIQAQILELLAEQVARQNAAVLLITHNLGVVARYADRVNVMYAGRLVESASADDLFDKPLHPYTLGLLQSVPRTDRHVDDSLQAIPGQPPPISREDKGCAFCDRCSFAIARCEEEAPPLKTANKGQAVACWVDIYDR